MERRSHVGRDAPARAPKDTDDLHAKILLGYAMQLLHEMPMLTRAAIRTALNP